ncbi:hypothetical protein [Alcanivorax sp. S71-1-4]|uniref:hypothetical protein n=1 Tax=Alcanivorax sp. S71-1-4 TaxID=1177159 RepID=UPI00135C712C|nr:hypothetical protein [Alcanivorax sp. S71-1-4]
MKNILSANEHLPSTALRAEISASLNLECYLDLDDTPLEKSDLFVQLLKHDIIEDNADTYTRLLGCDWKTREHFIHNSRKFQEYMNSDLVKGDLDSLFLSNQVNIHIKNLITDNASEYIQDGTRKGLVQLVRFAIEHKRELSIDAIGKLVSSGVPTQDVVILLEHHLEILSKDAILAILQSLDGDYPKLASSARDKLEVPNTPANHALLKRLKHLDIVSAYNSKDNTIKVGKV